MASGPKPSAARPAWSPLQAKGMLARARASIGPGLSYAPLSAGAMIRTCGWASAGGVKGRTFPRMIRSPYKF